MYQELLDKPGIYMIQNIITGDRYIGSAVSIRLRRNKHFSELKLGSHYNTWLQRAYYKYGKSNFTFIPIMICEKDDLIINEQAVIDKLKPEYNSRKDATSNIGFRHSAETKKRLSELQTGRPLTDSWIYNRDRARYVNILKNLDKLKFRKTSSGKYYLVVKHHYVGLFTSLEAIQHAYKDYIVSIYGEDILHDVQ